jgi:hypothetical protein
MSTLPPASPDESSVAAPTASASTETLAEGAVDASAVQMPGAPHAGTDSGAAASSDVSAPSANDTLIEPAPPVAAGVPASSAASSAESSAASSAESSAASSAETSAAAASSQLPTSDELRALFNEFLRAKKAAGVDDGLDVDFDAFADTIRGESERLIHDHGCRGVRFEVALAEGEVSLRPRLVR